MVFYITTFDLETNNLRHFPLTKSYAAGFVLDSKGDAYTILLPTDEGKIVWAKVDLDTGVTTQVQEFPGKYTQFSPMIGVDRSNDVAYLVYGGDMIPKSLVSISLQTGKPTIIAFPPGQDPDGLIYVN